MRSYAQAPAECVGEAEAKSTLGHWALALTSTLLLTGLTEAQESLRITSPAAEPGSTVTATIEITNSVPLEGFSCGVTYDPTMLTLVGATPGPMLDSSLGGTDPDTFLVQTNPGGQSGLTVACLMTLGAPPFATIPVGSNQPVVNIEYQAAAINGSTILDFVNTLGDPPVELLFVSDAIGITPTTTPGTVNIATIFYRGDCNLDGDVNLADAVCLLRILFLADPIVCGDSHDTDDNGTLTIIDAVVLLNYMFSGGATPPAPNPDTGCSLDPTPDALDCGTFGACP